MPFLSTIPQADLSQMDRDAEASPIMVMEKVIDLFARAADDSTRSQLRRTFCKAALYHSSIQEDTDPEAAIFDREMPDNVQHTIAICLLRLVAGCEAWAADAATFRNETFRLFDSCFSRALYGSLKLDARKQSFEKERVLKAYVLGTEEAIHDSLAALDSMENERWEQVKAALHEVKRAIGKAKYLLSPFVEKEMISGSRLEGIFGAVQEYFQADDATVESYQNCKSALEKYLLQAQRHGSRYSREYLAGLGLKLLQISVSRFEESGVSAPAVIVLKPLEKKYALHSAGATLNLSFVFNNVGPGYAFNVYCRIKNIDDAVEVKKSEQFVGDLAPHSITVEFPCLLKKSTASILVELEWEWQTFDRSTVTSTEMVELTGQPSGIDWDNLALQEPYRLDPVSTDTDLVGRTEILERLISHAKGTTVGSSCIYGQKRVGKTSIANALKSKLTVHKSPPFKVIYVERGAYVHPEANRTIEQLGSRLCRQIRQADERLQGLPIPAFEGALTPLFDFLDEVSRIVPDLRIVFILDEFDEVPVDIFKRGLIGDAFFGTIRSISHMPNVGFVLVGGERMQFVFDCQGEALNKFQTVRIDYFVKEREWSDFQNFVGRPVQQWLLFTDEAVVRLYTEAAGNPYFTVQICRSLFKLMVARRDCHVTSSEVGEAIQAALQDCSPPIFAHFWEDGILERGPKQEEKSMRRRQVLLAFVNALNRSGRGSKEEIVAGSQRFGMDHYAVERELGEFVHRHVLTHAGGMYACKVPFFERWLREVGPLAISTTFTDLEAIEAHKREEEKAHVRADEIVGVCTVWPQYKGRRIDAERVRAWLEQFGDNTEQRLMFKLLENVKFYSEDDVRCRMRHAHGMVTRGLVEKRLYRQVKRSDILVGYLDGPGKSGAHLARLYADENTIYRDNLVESSNLAQALTKEGVQALVFVDDLIGSGNSFSDYIQRFTLECGDALSHTQVRLFFIAVAGFHSGKEHVQETLTNLRVPMQVHVCDPLDDSHRCFSASSPIFQSEVDRLRAKDIAYRKGVTLCKQTPLGFNETQSLVVFSHNCPNNSLPILWDKTEFWTPLFRRD